MVTFNTVFKSSEYIKDYIKKYNIKDDEKLFIQIYSGILEKEYIQKVLYLLNSIYKKATIVGATTAGEIVNSLIYEKNIVISFVYLETANIKAEKVIYDDFHFKYEDAGKYLKKILVTDKTKFVLLLADGLKTNGEELAKGIDSNTNIVVGGGLAADYGQFKNTYVFLNDEIIENGAVAVAFDSDELKVFNYYTTGWKPIGRSFIVTKSFGNIVYELDNKPIYEVYKEYLGESIAKNLPYSAIEFPLMIEKNGIYLARAAISMNEDKALIFAGNVPEGSIVRFGFGNSLVILDTAGKLIKNEVFKKNIESLFIFSCIARKRFLGNLVNNEIKVLENVAPNIGFFTYGEFVTMKDGKELLNESLTLVAATEKKNGKKDFDLFDIDYGEENSSIRAINALIKLVEKTTKELEAERSDLLEKIKRDGLTGLLNKKSFFTLLKKHIELSNFSLVILDLDNFKDINDTKGHMVGDMVLKDVADIILSSIRRNDIAGRFGGEEFIVALIGANEKEAYEKAEIIRKKIEDLSRKYDFKISASFGISVKRESDDISSIIERADEALYFSKRNGKNKTTLL